MVVGLYDVRKNHPPGSGEFGGSDPVMLLYVTAPAENHDQVPAEVPTHPLHGHGGPGGQAPIVPAVVNGEVMVTGWPDAEKDTGSQQSPNVGTIPCR